MVYVIKETNTVKNALSCSVWNILPMEKNEVWFRCNIMEYSIRKVTRKHRKIPIPKFSEKGAEDKKKH